MPCALQGVLDLGGAKGICAPTEPTESSPK
jgi:hypothetical protein